MCLIVEGVERSRIDSLSRDFEAGKIDSVKIHGSYKYVGMSSFVLR